MFDTKVGMASWFKIEGNHQAADMVHINSGKPLSQTNLGIGIFLRELF